MSVEYSAGYLLSNEACYVCLAGMKLILPGASPRLPKDLVPPVHTRNTLPFTDPTLRPTLVPPYSVRPHVDGLTLP